MQMQEYAARRDVLASEKLQYDIPVRKEYILKQIGRGHRVLDVGCQGGLISQLIAQQNNEVWGIEINQEAAALARTRGIHVRVGNVEHGLPFESRSFDFVNAGEIIEHLYDTKAFFKECFRVLKPGGAFIFTTPNLNSLENRLSVLSGGYLSMVGAYPEDHFGNHVRIFNVDKIRELCAQTGFKLEEVRGVPTLGRKGMLVDLPLKIAARILPRFSKLLLVKVRKPDRALTLK